MRPEGNPLDLNNLPEEYGKQAVEESSTTTAASTETTRFKRKKSGGKDESGKVYECRFCSLKFCKSQALGGHMNRHRQERETETLNRARQLVYSNESISGVGPHLGYRDLGVGPSQPIPPGGFHHQFRPVYPRLPAQPPPQNPLQPYIYPSYPPPHPSVGDYFLGHVLPGSSQRPPNPHQSFGIDSSYQCFGAPLTQGFPLDGVRPPPTSRESVPSNHADGMNWNCGSSSADRFQDDF